MTGRDPRERRQLRERRPVAPARQQRERLLRTVVVAGVVASVGVFAVVAQARDAELGAPGAVDQVASDAGASPAGVAAAGPTTTVAATRPAGDRRRPADRVDTRSRRHPDRADRGLHDSPEDDHQRVGVDRRAVPPAGARRVRASTAVRSAASSISPRVRRSRRCRRSATCSSTGSPAAKPASSWESGRKRSCWSCARHHRPKAPWTAWASRLSSVASTGDKAPPLPENSGSGRRVVYERISQRVWAVSEDGEIIRSWLVAGSQYNNEMPGTHYVYSRSEQSTAWNGRAILPLMIRWLQTDIGHIGFHGIPIHVSDGSAVHDRGRARSAAVGWLPAPGQPRRPVHVGLRRRRHQSGRSLGFETEGCAFGLELDAAVDERQSPPIHRTKSSLLSVAPPLYRDAHVPTACGRWWRHRSSRRSRPHCPRLLEPKGVAFGPKLRVPRREDAEFVALRVGQDGPGLVGALADVDLRGAHRFEPGDLGVAVVARVRREVEVEVVLHRLGFGHLDEDEPRWNTFPRSRRDQFLRRVLPG